MNADALPPSNARWRYAAVAMIALIAVFLLFESQGREEPKLRENGIVVIDTGAAAATVAPVDEIASTAPLTRAVPSQAVLPPLSDADPLPPSDDATEPGAIRGNPDRTAPPTSANGGIDGDPETPPETGPALPAP